MNDILLNKMATVERCLQRIRDEFTDEAEFRQSFTKQDSVILNLQRACEACIDISNHIIRQQRLGIPQSARNSFELLQQAGLIPAELCEQMKNMVGLRNIAVHDYQALNLDIVVAVIQEHLSDFEAFNQTISAFN